MPPENLSNEIIKPNHRTLNTQYPEGDIVMQGENEPPTSTRTLEHIFREQVLEEIFRDVLRDGSWHCKPSNEKILFSSPICEFIPKNENESTFRVIVIDSKREAQLTRDSGQNPLIPNSLRKIGDPPPPAQKPYEPQSLWRRSLIDDKGWG